MKAGANVDELPATLGEASLDIVGKSVNADIERMLFGGDATNDNEFDGFVKILNDATDSIKVSGSTLTKANIIMSWKKYLLLFLKLYYSKVKMQLKSLFLTTLTER